MIYPVPQLNPCSTLPSDEGCDADGSACLPVDLSVRLRIVDHDGAEQLAARWRRRSLPFFLGPNFDDDDHGDDEVLISDPSDDDRWFPSAFGCHGQHCTEGGGDRARSYAGSVRRRSR